MFVILPLIALVVWFICVIVFKPSFLVGFLGLIVFVIGGFVIGGRMDAEKARGKIDKLLEWLKSLTGFTASSVANCSSANKLIAYDSASSKLALAILVADRVEGVVVDAAQITGHALLPREVHLQNDKIKKSGFVTFEVQPGQVITFYDLTVYLADSKYPAFALSFTDQGIANAWVGIVKGLQHRATTAPAEKQPDSAAPVSSNKSLMAELKELSSLHESGALSAPEFAQAKAKLLSSIGE